MIVKSVVLRCTPERAFALFTEEAGKWWPADRRHTDDPSSIIRIEPSGRFFERASDGTEIELGFASRFEAPHRLTLDWYPGTGAEHPTQVDVRLEAVDGGTRATIEHDLGAASAEVFARNAPVYARSWDRVLEAFAVRS